eukprot:TRINITY_DN3475_c0_g1_i2.p1 TRINITY_DN3475_c0_g1~~TRINITY_DN3475_c0_g1_i2.p1  ORF type:complete len:681 (+),score=221.09 TRINITY_DN3475_c0_g1_i2:76-2043(+)
MATAAPASPQRDHAAASRDPALGELLRATGDGRLLVSARVRAQQLRWSQDHPRVLVLTPVSVLVLRDDSSPLGGGEPQWALERRIALRSLSRVTWDPDGRSVMLQEAQQPALLIRCSDGGHRYHLHSRLVKAHQDEAGRPLPSYLGPADLHTAAECEELRRRIRETVAELADGSPERRAAALEAKISQIAGQPDEVRRLREVAARVATRRQPTAESPPAHTAAPSAPSPAGACPAAAASPPPPEDPGGCAARGPSRRTLAAALPLPAPDLAGGGDPGTAPAAGRMSSCRTCAAAVPLPAGAATPPPPAELRPAPPPAAALPPAASDAAAAREPSRRTCAAAVALPPGAATPPTASLGVCDPQAAAPAPPPPAGAPAAGGAAAGRARGDRSVSPPRPPGPHPAEPLLPAEGRGAQWERLRLLEHQAAAAAAREHSAHERLSGLRGQVLDAERRAAALEGEVARWRHAAKVRQRTLWLQQCGVLEQDAELVRRRLAAEERAERMGALSALARSAAAAQMRQKEQQIRQMADELRRLRPGAGPSRRAARPAEADGCDFFDSVIAAPLLLGGAGQLPPGACRARTPPPQRPAAEAAAQSSPPAARAPRHRSTTPPPHRATPSPAPASGFFSAAESPALGREAEFKLRMWRDRLLQHTQR